MKSSRGKSVNRLPADRIKNEEKRLLLALNGSNSGAFDWHLKTDRVYLCEHSKDMLGFNEEKRFVTASQWFSRIHHDDLRCFKSNFKKYIAGKTPCFECEYRIENDTKNIRWVLIRGTAIKNSLNELTRLTGLQIDITAKKKSEQNLKAAFDELQFALASEKILMEELDLKNKELTELSITDGLTGLFNHRFLQERFDFELKRIRRYSGELSCMLIDIDHFKLVNDTYGHQFGDHVLREIAQTIKNKSRDIDICGRYGGEEFMVITNLNGEDALKYAAKLHAAIENFSFIRGSKTVKVTVSIGVADYRNDIKSKQELIERADTALYKAKTDGRNLIRLWKENVSEDDKSINRLGVLEMKSKFVDLSKQIRSSYMDSINALVKVVDSKDPFAIEHSNNVCRYSVEIAKKMNLSDIEIEAVRNAALLHDIGKICIKDEVLVKKEQLTQRERDLLKKHPETGVNILKELKFLEKELPMILHHHERYDGTGYPFGLKGREIPIGARIISVADAFDAMVSGRVYKKKLPWKSALDELVIGANTQFAPELVELFVLLVKTGKIKKTNS